MDENLEYDSYLSARELRLLEILYSTHSVTKTADQLGQTQPTISSWLKRIRDQLKDPLFVRTSEGMSPTPRAEIVVSKAREILEAMRLINGGAPRFDPRTSTRVFRMCIPDAAQITLMPGMLRFIRINAPHVQIEALPVDTQTELLLESGEADLAFGGFVSGLEAGFYQQTLFEQDFVCLVSNQHPRIKEQLTLDDYQREAHIAVGYGSANAVIETELKRQHVERRVLLSLQGVLGVGQIIATTDMITTLPGQIGATLAARGAVRLFQCPVPMHPIVVKQYWHTRFHRDPGNQWLRAVCAKQARSSAADIVSLRVTPPSSPRLEDKR
jgi:DNA-binding transcriptional LysR family regulator